MANAIAEKVTSPVEAGSEESRAAAKRPLQVLRWLGLGILTVVGVSLFGGLVVGLAAGQSFGAGSSVELCAKAIRIYDLLVVSPLAIGTGAALVVGVPITRKLRAAKSQPGTTRFKTVMRVLAGVKLGFLTAALFWSVSGMVVPGTSIAAAHAVNGDSTAALHDAFYGFKLPSVEYWSIFGSIGLALLLIVVAMVSALRPARTEARSANQQVLGAASVLTLLFGFFLTWHGVVTYDDLSHTKVTSEQGQK